MQYGNPHSPFFGCGPVFPIRIAGLLSIAGFRDLQGFQRFMSGVWRTIAPLRTSAGTWRLRAVFDVFRSWSGATRNNAIRQRGCRHAPAPAGIQERPHRRTPVGKSGRLPRNFPIAQRLCNLNSRLQSAAAREPVRELGGKAPPDSQTGCRR
jgi:hypothetical protein